MHNNFMAQFDTAANAEAGAKLHFVCPNGDLAYTDFEKAFEKDKDGNALLPVKAVTVTMLGAGSDAHKKHAISEIRKARGNAKKSHGKKDTDIPDTFFDDISESQVKRLIAVVTSWENISDGKGEALECNEVNVKAVFTKYQPLRIQAIEFLDSEVNFIKS